jgi:hypothetical protein
MRLPEAGPHIVPHGRAHAVQPRNRRTPATASGIRASAARRAIARSRTSGRPEPRRRPGRELGTLATRFADAGIQLGYHNHNWELKPEDGGTTALELVFAKAEGSPLTWQADVAWLVRGGAEPDMWLWRYRDRLVSAHVKDIAPAGEKLDEDGWADVGAVGYVRGAALALAVAAMAAQGEDWFPHGFIADCAARAAACFGVGHRWSPAGWRIGGQRQRERNGRATIDRFR